MLQTESDKRWYGIHTNDAEAERKKYSPYPERGWPDRRGISNDKTGRICNWASDLWKRLLSNIVSNLCIFIRLKHPLVKIFTRLENLIRLFRRMKIGIHRILSKRSSNSSEKVFFRWKIHAKQESEYFFRMSEISNMYFM